jgi:HEAT repeat protein
LGNIGIDSKEVISAVGDRLLQKNEPDDHVRLTAALTYVKFKNENSIPYLTQVFSDSCRYVREYSLIALDRISTEDSLEVFKAYREKFKGLDPLTTVDSTF